MSLLWLWLAIRQIGNLSDLVAAFRLDKDQLAEWKIEEAKAKRLSYPTEAGPKRSTPPDHDVRRERNGK